MKSRTPSALGERPQQQRALCISGTAAVMTGGARLYRLILLHIRRRVAGAAFDFSSSARDRV